jgi:flagellar protein FliS
MMYEGAIKYVKKAQIAVDKRDIAERGTNIGRAFDIVMELNNTLNHEVGGELAKNLEQLYMFITDQLSSANITGKREPLDHALKVLQTLHEGWIQAIEKLKREEHVK